jgi:hypothetical protein
VVVVEPVPVPWVRGVVLVVVVAAIVDVVEVEELVDVEVGAVLGTVVVVGGPGLVVVTTARVVVVVVVVGGTVVVVGVSTLVAPGTKKSPLGVCTTAPVAVPCGGLK